MYKPVNKELLEKVKEAILAEPESYDQAVWGKGTTPSCNTPCCIAGHAIFIADPESYGNAIWKPSIAADLIGGCHPQSLFHACNWPIILKEEFYNAPLQSLEQAKVAAEVIDVYINTNGFDVDGW